MSTFLVVEFTHTTALPTEWISSLVPSFPVKLLAANSPLYIFTVMSADETAALRLLDHLVLREDVKEAYMFVGASAFITDRQSQGYVAFSPFP